MNNNLDKFSVVVAAPSNRIENIWMIDKSFPTLIEAVEYYNQIKTIQKYIVKNIAWQTDVKEVLDIPNTQHLKE